MVRREQEMHRMPNMRKPVALGKSCICEARICFALSVALCWAGMALAQEPVHEGKSLTEWLAQAESGSPTASFSNAVVAMGTNILPRLIDELDPPATTNRIYARGAVEACRILGTNAQPAAPALARRLAQGNAQAAVVMLATGPEAIPLLTETLVQMPPSCYIQYSAINALGACGARARLAVTNLALLMEEAKIPAVRNVSARALGAIGGDLLAANPRSKEGLYAKAALVKALPKAAELMQRGILEGLGKFKESASDIAPLLYQFLLEKQRRNGTEELIKRIEKTLDQIDPQKVYRTGTTS
jgi:hypothetical protein